MCALSQDIQSLSPRCKGEIGLVQRKKGIDVRDATASLTAPTEQQQIRLTESLDRLRT
jgi:hypothetical protein